MSDTPPAQPAAASPFASVDEVIDRFAEHGYISDQRLATTTYLLSQLNKPLLLEGPAGVGKTELAKTLAAATGRRLLRLQCYEGQDESKALYEWDYGKQLLYTQMLRDKISEVVSDAPDLHTAVERIGAQDSVFFSDRFLAPRPLLDAIRGEEPAVLLIDEVDRADEALEAVLLECLGEYQVSVPEIGTYTAMVPPYVVLTSNNTRDLSAALKRRCLHLFLDYPNLDRELEIIRSKNTGLPDAVASQLVAVVRELRKLPLRKAPSISETIDWARTLAVLGVQELTAQVLADTANVVMKYERDLGRALDALPSLVDPNRTIDDVEHGHGHGHGHGHNHGHDHGKDDSHEDSPTASAEPASASEVLARQREHRNGSGPDGVAVRAAKDDPGRFDDNYYGTRGPGKLNRSAVSTEQGRRSWLPSTKRRPV